MRSARGISWQSGSAGSYGPWECEPLRRNLEALYVPALGTGSLSTSGATLVDAVRRRDATTAGTLSYQRTALGPAISLLGSGARLVVNNTADKYNFVHQRARFSLVVVLRLSLVGLTHGLVDNALGFVRNVRFAWS